MAAKCRTTNQAKAISQNKMSLMHSLYDKVVQTTAKRKARKSSTSKGLPSARSSRRSARRTNHRWCSEIVTTAAKTLARAHASSLACIQAAKARSRGPSLNKLASRKEERPLIRTKE